MGLLFVVMFGFLMVVASLGCMSFISCGAWASVVDMYRLSNSDWRAQLP